MNDKTLHIIADKICLSCGDVELTLAGKNDILSKINKVKIELPDETVEFVNTVKFFDLFRCPVCGAKCKVINNNTIKTTCNCDAGIYQI